MDRIKWAIIGTGRIARKFAEALAGVPEAEMYAVGSRSLEKAVAFAAETGFEKAYGCYDELLSDSEVDAVYIATPMSSHYGDCIAAISRGRNVLCEKSVTVNAGQLREILGLAREKGVLFSEAMWTKCRPSYLKMKEWVSSGRIGEIRCIKADFSNFVPYDPNDRLFRADCGGGALLDVGVYPLTLVHDLLGAPSEVQTAANIGADGVDLTNTVTLRYENGAFASVDSGFEVPLKNNAVIIGTEGSVAFGDYFFCSDCVTLYDSERREVEHFSESARINGYEYEIEEFCRTLAAGLSESPLMPHSETLAVMELMDSIRHMWGMKYPGEI